MRRLIKKYRYYLYSIGELLAGFREWLSILYVFSGLARPGIRQVTLRRNGLKFMVRGAMDVWSLKETFLDRFYERFGFQIADGWRIVDIGAGIGDFTLFAAAGRPNNRVYAFEPYPASFELLRANLGLNGITNVQLFPQAIGDQTGTISLDISGNEPLQIRSELAETSLSRENQMDVPSLSLADAFTQLQLENCQLVKLDCEGAEYPILLNTPPSVLYRIERIILEYHDFGIFTPHALVEHLSRHGFDVQIYSNPVHKYLGYLSAQRGDIRSGLALVTR